MNKYLTGASLIALSIALENTAIAQVEEIVVTATKRAASTQDIPVAVQALGENTLEELDVDVFSDYLLQLPGVTAGGSGPGQGTIYIRGLASTTPNLTTAGVAGLAPNVALYFDEQPVTQVGRNLDVYAADLNRIEVLPGPQGTLFGASSQAGTIRLITNRPNFDEFEARASGGVSFTEGGEASEKLELVINYPIVEGKLAVRGVFYTDNQGGYIDNVAGTRTAAESARFQSSTPRPNGVPTSDGFQAGADLSGVTFLETNNLELVEDNFNDASYDGFRLALGYDIDDDWSFFVTHTRQQIDSEGVFFIDPELDDDDDLSVQRFSRDEIEDDFDNTSWTLEGRLGALDVVYTGAFLNRDTDQTVDYTDYLFVGQYLPYYICDGSVTYPGDAAPSGTCQPPNLFVDSETETEVFTHELRFTTPEENRLRSTFGGFYSDQELVERNNFTYPGSQFAESFTPGVFGFPQNGALPGSSVSDPNPRPVGVIFFNDITRTDKQFGLFAEVTYDLIPDTLSITGGARYHDVDVRLRGSANSSFGNFGGVDVNNFGTNLDTQFDGTQVINGVQVPEGAEAEGVVFKGNISWTPDDTSLFYFTYSEGFRPGLPNRPAGAGNGAVPAVVRTDEVTNYEIGWKLDLFDNSVRFNGNAFFVDIQDLQTTIFDPTVTNLFFSDNAADAEIWGIEGDVTWAPPEVPGLTVTGAFSILDTEITELVGASVAIAAPGEDLSYAPSFQGNLRARYEWDYSDDIVAHIQPSIAYSGSSFSDVVLINRIEQDDYFLLGFAFGIRTDKWSAEIFGENLTDERAELNNSLVFDRERTTINRPRTWGVRFSVDF
ncbi:TonB-dependent receptor [Kordiimonas sp. SCSIO 12610]|uniref:TonB-dependent receptor n=1 Tax=Kordiimonas sp. SCSIO 12610 TaxID=2829597 RepID=UPI00210BB314|nr:TonB-dependent receptor plug domain-containing protein [Kordiimonas sp. SCSIO 12610]UTW54675.1 TonB-dependent receptor plug domain-containing protein [Kordiimonas sp. SCSIO 12610]